MDKAVGPKNTDLAFSRSGLLRKGEKGADTCRINLGNGRKIKNDYFHPLGNEIQGLFAQ